MIRMPGLEFPQCFTTLHWTPSPPIQLSIPRLTLRQLSRRILTSTSLAQLSANGSLRWDLRTLLCLTNSAERLDTAISSLLLLQLVLLTPRQLAQCSREVY